MRLAPVAIRHWRDRETLRDVAARQSRTTHGAPEAVDACIAFAGMVADAIAGAPRSAVMQAWNYPFAGGIAGITAGSWRGKRRSEIHSSGYVAHSLEAALWCVGRTATFHDAIVLAANLGDDADTTAAITVASGVSGVGVLIPSESSEERLAITVSAVTEHMTMAEARKLASELTRAIKP